MLKILCYKNELVWPRSTGHDVALYHLMQELHRLGATVGFSSRLRPTARALDGLTLAFAGSLEDDAIEVSGAPTSFSWLQERYRSYYGVPHELVGRFGNVAREFQADAVIVSGLPALPMLAGLSGFVRIWHAGDDWLLHHLSLVQSTKLGTWSHVRVALLKGLYERSYGSLIDRAWVVTTPDAAFMRWTAGVRNVDILPNGVDSQAFRPQNLKERPRSLVFWGRLDFEPNVQSLEWFFGSGIWAELRRRHPDATFTVMGFSPVPEVGALASIPGVQVLPNVDDINPVVCSHAVVALPIVSGAGIKNKLLEAAALGRPIVCTPRAMLGLKGNPPIVRAQSAREFIDAIERLWASDEERSTLGSAAREWVVKHHSWESAARIGLSGIESALASRARG